MFKFQLARLEFARFDDAQKICPVINQTGFISMHARLNAYATWSYKDRRLSIY